MKEKRNYELLSKEGKLKVYCLKDRKRKTFFKRKKKES